LPGPDDITRVQLSNGITVLARANFSSPSVVINGSLTAGSLFDRDEAGLADFTAEALMRVRRSDPSRRSTMPWKRPALAWVLAVGRRSPVLVGGRWRRSGFAVDLLAEALRQPIFPEDQVERLRAHLLTGLAIRPGYR
jgi:zinc protease